jgi:hypothetical protein
LTRTITFQGGVLSVIEVPIPYDIHRMGVEFELRHDGMSRRLYVPPGCTPIDQAGLDRLPEEVLAAWWHAAHLGSYSRGDRERAS